MQDADPIIIRALHTMETRHHRHHSTNGFKRLERWLCFALLASACHACFNNIRSKLIHYLSAIFHHYTAIRQMAHAGI